MRKPTLARVPGLAIVWALLSLGAATAQTLPAQVPAPPAAMATADIDLLKGAWLRPDGGYTIVIRNVGASGQLEAMYYNPSQLPFAKAQASRSGGELRAFFELRAGGYDGSTYDLTYDAGNDRLTGTYYQAVAKQKFDIFFVRKK